MGNVTSVWPAPGVPVLTAKWSGHQSHKYSPSMSYQLCHSSTRPFYVAEWTRHWLTPRSVWSVSKLSFTLKHDVDKLAAMLWVLAISLLLCMPQAMLCTDTGAIAMHVCKCIFHIHRRFKHRYTCSCRRVCLKASIFLWRGRANSTKHWGAASFRFAPAIVVCKSCEVQKHFTSLKTDVLTAVLAVEATQLIYSEVTFCLSED